VHLPAMLPNRAVSVLIAFLVLAGCSHAQPPVVAANAVQSNAHATPAAVTATGPLPADAIRRSAIRSVLAAGPGAFLQKVSLDDQPVLAAGKFHGFRIASLQADSFGGVDLKPGDVVTRIDGMPIEHPEEAIEAFMALQVASELRVDYERGGVARTLRYRIVEDDGPAPSPMLAAPRSR